MNETTTAIEKGEIICSPCQKTFKTMHWFDRHVKMKHYAETEKPVPKITTDKVPDNSDNATNQFIDLVSALAQSVESLKGEVAAIKQVEPRKEDVLAINQPVVAPQPAINFFNQIPAEILQVATEVLGEKFQFECEASKDKPSFVFTVLVPREYSNVKETGMKGELIQDRRTRVIPNVLGTNGVREWCERVKANVVKYLGTQIVMIK